MIKLQCTCRRMLKLPDDLAGQKIRCKHCQKVLSVPRSGSRRFVQHAAEEDDSSELLVAGSRVCPGCGQTYPPTIVVCTACGLNLDTGATLYASLEDQQSPQFMEEQARQDEAAKQGFFARLLAKLGSGKKG